jgi:hypothetical protein
MGKGYRKPFIKASGEPDALKGASPVRLHGKLGVQVLSPLPKHLNVAVQVFFFWPLAWYF